jgi:hypothetical protein
MIPHELVLVVIVTDMHYPSRIQLLEYSNVLPPGHFGRVDDGHPDVFRDVG